MVSFVCRVLIVATSTKEMEKQHEEMKLYRQSSYTETIDKDAKVVKTQLVKRKSGKRESVELAGGGAPGSGGGDEPENKDARPGAQPGVGKSDSKDAAPRAESNSKDAPGGGGGERKLSFAAESGSFFLASPPSNWRWAVTGALLVLVFETKNVLQSPETSRFLYHPLKRGHSKFKENTD